jgi:hypothetical protein
VTAGDGEQPFECRLSAAAGVTESCPGERCPFWSDGACVIGGLSTDLVAEPGLRDLLLELRERLRALGDAGRR